MITDDIKRYYSGELTLMEIIVLCRKSGLSGPATAELLGVSLSTVYSNSSKAARRRKLAANRKSDAKRKRAYIVKTPDPTLEVDKSGWDEPAGEPWISPGFSVPVAAPEPEPVLPVPRSKSEAWNLYFDGDRGALSRWLAAH